MNRSHSTIYRICLLAVVVLTIAGGIFYYVNVVEKQATVTEGTLVWSVKPKEGIEEGSQNFPNCIKAKEERFLGNSGDARGKEGEALGSPQNGIEAERPEDGTVVEGFRPFGSIGKQA